MTDVVKPILEFMSSDKGASIVRALIVVGGGYFLAWSLSRGVVRAFRRYLDPQREMVVRRGIFYALLLLAVVTAMNDLGFKFSTLLGAAGILTVAIGFASQTSMSNLISGLFLIGEESFKVGDTIQIGTTIGEVLSIDLLSVKLRTFDNLFVRIPNEQMIKSEVTNLSRFAIRRVDLQLRVGIGSDFKKVEDTLLDVIRELPLCLEDPAPQILLQSFGPSELNVDLRAWVQRENFLAYRSNIMHKVKDAFEKNGIEIPVPHRALVVKEGPTQFLSPPDPSAPAVPAAEKALQR